MGMFAHVFYVYIFLIFNILLQNEQASVPSRRLYIVYHRLSQNEEKVLLRSNNLKSKVNINLKKCKIIST